MAVDFLHSAVVRSGGSLPSPASDRLPQETVHFIPGYLERCGIDSRAATADGRGVKLSRLVGKNATLGERAARMALAAGRVTVDGVRVTCGTFEVGRFSRVELDGTPLQEGGRAVYLMLHKPVGVLSATSDGTHRTVIDLIDDPDRGSLHLAGRLDRATSGLVLLTNDGRWSKRITAAAGRVAKVYRVETREAIGGEAVEAFARGFFFHTEGITTLPAELVILGEREARLTLWEGRYHQVKRMFHRVGNRVVALHRERIGGLALPEDLPAGGWRELGAAEVGAVFAGTEGSGNC